MMHSPFRQPTQHTDSSVKRRHRAGLTLIELLIVVTMLSILAAMVIPNLASNNYDLLLASAQIVEGELSYARNLAAANGTQYKVQFEPSENRLIMTHTGTNSAFDSLPSTPFRNPSDPANQQITDFDDLPKMQDPVTMVGGFLVTTGYPGRNYVEFGPLGNTVNTAESTVLYLYSGSGQTRLYISITVDATTGLVTVGTPTSSIPVFVDG